MKLQVFNLLMVFVKNRVSSHSSVQPIKTCQVHEKINSLWNRIEEKSPSLQHNIFSVGEKCGQPEYLSGFPDTQFKIKTQERVKETWQALLVQ